MDRPWAAWVGCGCRALAVTVILVSLGCRLVEESTRLPVAAAAAVIPRSKADRPDPAALQAELHRYSDEYASRTVAALNDYARIQGTLTATNEALAWKLSLSSTCVGLASGEHPTANLLDFVTLATMVHRTLEDEVRRSGEAAGAMGPWLEVSRELELDAWGLADGILTDEQRQDLRAHIDEWWDANAGTRAGFFARPEQFTSLTRQVGEKSHSSESLLSLIGLDPTAGLDPAVREVTRTRLFAERALFVAQRMPYLLRWHVELLSSQLLNDPTVLGTLAQVSSLSESASRLSRAAEAASATAAVLPDHLARERQAILDALETQEGRLRELSTEVGRTLEAGDRMFVSLNTAVQSFDALMKRFGVGEPATAPSAPESRPFDILEYAETADRIAALARQLEVLLGDTRGTLDSPALEQRLASLQAVADRARSDVRSVLNHAFLLAAGLVILMLTCALAYRRLGKAVDRPT